jgi:hypothetical protein
MWSSGGGMLPAVAARPDPVAARRVIAAVMTWPKGPSQWIAGSARPLGRMLLDLDIVPAQLVGFYVGAAPHPGGGRAKPG